MSIKALLGNLVEFVRSEDDILRFNIIHRSLSAYLAQTRWILVRLSSVFLQHCPNDFWAPFASGMVKQSSQAFAVDITITLHKLQETVRAAAQAREASLVAHHRVDPSELWRLFHARVDAAQGMWFLIQDWKPWGDLLLYILDYWFNITTLPSLNASAFRAQAEDLALLHLVYCRSCTIMTNWRWWLWKRLLRLHGNPVLNLVLQLYHGTSQSAIDMLEERQREGLSLAILEDLYDVAFVSYSQLEVNLAFLKFLEVKFAIYVDVRHLCTLETVPFRRDNDFQHQMNQRPAAIPWTIAHDQDCPYHHHPTTVSVLKHWMNLDVVPSSQWLSNL